MESKGESKMKKAFKKLILLMGVLMVLFGSVSAACADCIYAGRPYPTGTIINGYVCQPNGTWGK
jgi:hypothetical protein